jgi:hypothetical protein
MGRRTAQRIFAAAALLTLIFASAATGGTWSRCRMTGVLLPVCCCPADAAADDGQLPPTSVEAGDCCERVVTSVDQGPSEIAARDTLAAPAVVVASNDTAVRGAGAANILRGRIERSSAGPPSTRAFLLSKSSLLI